MHSDTGTVIASDTAALTIEPDMSVSLLVPALDDDDEVPPHIMFLTAVMIRATSEDEWFQEQVEWLTHRTKE